MPIKHTLEREDEVIEISGFAVSTLSCEWVDMLQQVGYKIATMVVLSKVTATALMGHHQHALAWLKILNDCTVMTTVKFNFTHTTCETRSYI